MPNILASVLNRKRIEALDLLSLGFIDRLSFGKNLGESRESIIARGNEEIEFWEAKIEEIKKYSREQTNNIISIRSGKNDIGLHPTQKPLLLMKALIEMTTIPDHLVLDPFCGSGTTLVAAMQLGRKYLGIELGNEFYNIAVKRLEQEREIVADSLFKPKMNIA